MRLLIIFILSLTLFSANIKTELKQTKNIISNMNKRMDKLAKEIRKKENELKKLNTQIQKLDKEIKKLELELKDSNQKLNELNDLKKGELEKLNNIQNEIDNFLSTNYYLNKKNIDNINDLINYELTKKALDFYSKKIETLIKSQKNIQKNIANTNKQINDLLNKRKLLKQKKAQIQKLLNKRKKEILVLKKKKLEYKLKLYAMINKAKRLRNKLSQLAVIKRKTNIKANYVYKGIKTIPPLKGKVIKYFGSYIDPIYKIKIYNDSITIKPYQKNAIVRSIMPGKVVYIGQNDDKKIIVIKHKNNIFSIYANLNKVSPLIKKGKYVKRGQIIARVEDSLEFEVTYKEKPINPLKVIRLR
ncbi:peptidase M23 [Caminibacter mediatlanticus TB-2]|uniref:Peptidase M23 n=1 Tax=Caminibacter mediatlanticus TB-2 TaxID=391592 RepID=A0AAI9AIV2_9BACT|nr:peptidoglycan DD-metalloendopeptidase family protein [Caminibacter mediatlanticus]EDM24473.1 Peptidase M23B [Caminibacter mediatlanticus TB-2]QCT95120.1 peptidase M23 [Caminibacter mediatlanticus TB-2]